MESKEKLQNFIVRFFENLRAELVWDGRILIVKNVPESFEEAYGKKAPYCFVFEKQDQNSINELVESGCKILEVIKRSLENLGNTTLLKLDFDLDPTEIIRKRLQLKSYNVSDLKMSSKNKFFYRFTFQTSFHYLNKKEQILNEVYVHDGEIVKGDLSGYPVSEGKKEEISVEDIEKNYEIAKLTIKSLTNNKTHEISKYLTQEIESEIAGVKEHFSHQAKEIEEQIKKERRRVITLGDELMAFNSEDLKERLERARKNLERLEGSDEFKRINKEEILTIENIQHKYSLNIENKLINTTVIYYPEFIFSIFFDNNLKKQIKISYNPLTDKIGKPLCTLCTKEITKINICSEGHIACSNCLDICKGCGENFCKNCLKHSCAYCGKKFCKNCVFRCNTCGKYFCKAHITKDIMTGEFGCVKCFKVCPKCKNSTSLRFFKKGSKGYPICLKCYGLEVGKEITDNLMGG